MPEEVLATALCESSECVHAASEILYNLDPNRAEIDPCTDFDRFVCGGWKERHDMRSDQGAISSGSIMSESAQVRLRHILESERDEFPEESSPDFENFHKLKTAYDACLEEPAVKARGTEPLDDVLDHLEKIYPADSSSVKGSNDNLTNAVLYLMEIGVEALVSSYIGVRNHICHLTIYIVY